MKLKTQGAEIFFTADVELDQLDKKNLLFVFPGGPGLDHVIYRDYLKPLREDVDMIYFDPRGCGKSTVENINSCTMENYIADVELIRNYLQATRISILGSSYGSKCAMAYAIKYPHVNKLILVAGAPSYRFLAQAKHNVKTRGTPEQQKVCELLWEGKFKSKDELINYIRLTRPLYSMQALREGTLESHVQKQAQHFSYQVLNFGFSTFMREYDFENELKNIHCPTLILSGKNDWINDPKQQKIMAQKIPHAKLIELDAGHSMAIDQPEEYFLAIKNFLSNSNR